MPDAWVGFGDTSGDGIGMFMCVGVGEGAEIDWGVCVSGICIGAGDGLGDGVGLGVGDEIPWGCCA
jgi:hypothetical protein